MLCSLFPTNKALCQRLEKASIDQGSSSILNPIVPQCLITGTATLRGGKEPTAKGLSLDFHADTVGEHY